MPALESNPGWIVGRGPQPGPLAMVSHSMAAAAAAAAAGRDWEQWEVEIDWEIAVGTVGLGSCLGR